LSPELAKRAYTKSRYNRQMAFNKADETDRIANVKKQDRQAKKFAGYAAKKEEDEMAIMSLDHNEAPRKLKLTQQGLEAFKQSRDELDEAGRPRGAAHIENTRFWDLKDKELHYIIKDAGKAIQANPTAKKATQGPGNWSDQVNDAATVLYYRKNKKIKVEAFEGPFTAAGSGSIAKQRKAKAGDENKSIEQQMADAMKESFQRIREAQWKIKLRGLPSFYVPGKSAGAVRQMLRKQLKRPMDDIEDIVRATPAAKKKDFRDRAQGQQDSAVGSGKDK